MTDYLRPHQQSHSYITKQLNLILNSIDKHVDHEHQIGYFIYGLLYDGYSKEEIVKQIKDIPKQLSLIAQKTLDYIDYQVERDWWYQNEFCVEAIEIFYIVCLLDLQQTKKYYDMILDPDNKIIVALANKNYKINRIYQNILESYIIKERLEREIEDLKSKYKLLETHLKYMPGGEGYLETMEHFENCSKKES
jgi:hypothetical protein